MKPKKNPVRDLPRGVSIRKTCNGRGRVMWRVRLGRKFTKSGVLERNFPSIEAAREFLHGKAENATDGIEALRDKFGLTAIELSPRELAESREALAALRAAKAGTLREAVRFYLRHHTTTAAMTMGDAILTLIKAKQAAGRSPLHTEPLKSRLLTLAASANVSLVSELTRRDVEKWIEGLDVSPITKANALRDVRIFCRFCRSRGLMPHDPLAGIERPNVIAGEAGILAPAQVRKLLSAAEPAIVPSLAIKLFAGLRSAEVRRLDWQDVTAKHVIVRAGNAKTRSRRAVDITENLAAWLVIYRKNQGPVVGMKAEQWHQLIRKAACDADTAALDTQSPDLIGKLPQNFARHSFGTYHYAMHQDEAKTAAAMGNTPAMVHRHYRALATADEARAFFDIKPQSGGQILAFVS